MTTMVLERIRHREKGDLWEWEPVSDDVEDIDLDMGDAEDDEDELED